MTKKKHTQQMGRPKKAEFTQEQKAYILEHRLDKTITRIGKDLKLPYNAVRTYMIENELQPSEAELEKIRKAKRDAHNKKHNAISLARRRKYRAENPLPQGRPKKAKNVKRTPLLSLTEDQQLFIRLNRLKMNVQAMAHATGLTSYYVRTFLSEEGLALTKLEIKAVRRAKRDLEEENAWLEVAKSKGEKLPGDDPRRPLYWEPAPSVRPKYPERPWEMGYNLVTMQPEAKVYEDKGIHSYDYELIPNK